jgi:hypothetical protein
MNLFVSVTEIKKDVRVTINPKYMAKYPEHHEKIFKVLDIDDENYCELEWINDKARERIVYIPKSDLQISK